MRRLSLLVAWNVNITSLALPLRVNKNEKTVDREEPFYFFLFFFFQIKINKLKDYFSFFLITINWQRILKRILKSSYIDLLAKKCILMCLFDMGYFLFVLSLQKASAKWWRDYYNSVGKSGNWLECFISAHRDELYKETERLGKNLKIFRQAPE